MISQPLRRSAAYPVVIAFPLVAWALYCIVALPGGLSLGLGFTAFLLGMRHAFDADHIAAIDNTTRKLVTENREPSTVGLWFALGHSTVVIVAIALISGGVTALVPQIRDDSSQLSAITGLWGPLVSGVFLLTIGTVNLIALIRLVRSGQRTVDRATTFGPVTRLVSRCVGSLDRAWKMYFVGFLFGLGFDTASTIALLLMAGGASISAPWYAAMIVPLLFTAGMVACDGLNGVIMTRAYRWTNADARKNARYEIGLLAISVTAAFAVAGIGLTGVVLAS